MLTVLSMYFIGVSGLRVLPLSINGWMDGWITVQLNRNCRPNCNLLFEMTRLYRLSGRESIKGDATRGMGSAMSK